MAESAVSATEDTVDTKDAVDFSVKRKSVGIQNQEVPRFLSQVQRPKWIEKEIKIGRCFRFSPSPPVLYALRVAILRLACRSVMG
jgi:hypothetical protein